MLICAPTDSRFLNPYRFSSHNASYTQQTLVNKGARQQPQQ